MYSRYRQPLPPTRRVTAKILALGVAAALGIGGLISVEMASGNDPALGPKATASKSKPTPASSGSSQSSAGGSGGDPYSQPYGSDGGYSYGGGTSGYSTSPAPVTSGTS
jgi:hypothetical protein